MKNIANKVVWITGASSGIGEALAYQLAKKGAILVLTARNAQKLSVVQSNCLKHCQTCHVFPADLSETSHLKVLVQEVIQTTGTIDLLINNAGISQRSLVKDTPIANDRKIMELNFFSVVALSKLVLPYMLSQKSGHIVVTSSIVGKFGFPLRSAYSASKHALQGYFDSLRAEVTKENIKVTIVSPGRIKTEISKHALTQDGKQHGEMDLGQDNGLDANTCAHQIVQAIIKDKKDVLVGRKELLMVYIHKYLPFLYHSLVQKIAHK